MICWQFHYICQDCLSMLVSKNWKIFTCIYKNWHVCTHCQHVCSSVNKLIHLWAFQHGCSSGGMIFLMLAWLFPCWKGCSSVDIFVPISIRLLPYWYGCSSISMIVLMLQCLFLNQHVCSLVGIYFLVNNDVFHVNILLCRQVCFSGNRVDDLLAIVQA